MAAALRLPHPTLTTCLHLLLLNPARHGQLAVLYLLTLWEPGSASPAAPLWPGETKGCGESGHHTMLGAN